jgi:hypothetical protein
VAPPDSDLARTERHGNRSLYSLSYRGIIAVQIEDCVGENMELSKTMFFYKIYVAISDPNSSGMPSMRPVIPELESAHMYSLSGVLVNFFNIGVSPPSDKAYNTENYIRYRRRLIENL